MTTDPHLTCRRDRQGNCMGLHCPRCGEPTGYAGCQCRSTEFPTEPLQPSESVSPGLSPSDPMLPNPEQVQRLLEALSGHKEPDDPEALRELQSVLTILRDHGDRRPTIDVVLAALWSLADHVQERHVRCDHA